MLAVFLPLDPARAQLFVSVNGQDTNSCFSWNAPCRTFDNVLRTVILNGLSIITQDSGDFGAVVIDRSISIINGSGAALIKASDAITQGGRGQIVIEAGATGVVTLRGLTFNGTGVFGSAIVIANAQRVNIEDCLIEGSNSPAILVAPAIFRNPSLASSISVTIRNTIIRDSYAGIKISSVPNLPVTVSISGSAIENNGGGGIRVDGTSGGPIKVAVSDSTISLNGSNGVLALSGPSGSVTVNVTRSVIASNGLYGVQSNQTSGGTAAVTVSASTLTNNGSGAVGSFGGGALLTFGDNRLVGSNGTGFTGPIALQ